MYNYDFKEKEEQVKYENNQTIIEIDDKTYELSLLVTNKNILLFNNANKNNVLNSRGMYMPPEYLLELSIPLNNLKYSIKDNNTYLKVNNKDIIIYNFNLEEVK